MKRLLFVGVIAIAIVGGFYMVREAQNAHAAPARIAEGYDQLNSQARARNEQLEEKNRQLSFQIVELLREGNGRASQDELKGYAVDLKKLKAEAKSDLQIARKLDQDIAWCEKRIQ